MNDKVPDKIALKQRFAQWAGSIIAAFKRHKRVSMGVTAVIILLLIIFGIFKGIEYKNNLDNRQAAAAVAKKAEETTKLPTLDDSLKEINDNKLLSQKEKDDAIVAIGYQHLYEGKYDMAEKIATIYLDKPAYANEVRCQLLLGVYEGRGDGDKLKETARVCLLIKTPIRTTDDITEASKLYELAVLSEQASSDKVKDYYRSYVNFVEAKKIQNDEMNESRYAKAKEKL